MYRTIVWRSRLPKEVADGLNRESARVYNDVLEWHYVVYQEEGRWPSNFDAQKANRRRLPVTILHTHSRDAAVDAFYIACKAAKANRSKGAKFPTRPKQFRTTIWPKTAIKKLDGQLRLSLARGQKRIFVKLPVTLNALPQAAIIEMRLVYNPAGKHYDWHLMIDDGLEPPPAPGRATLAADLGEIHPAAIANEQGQVVIFTARQLRSLNRYRNKTIARLQSLMARKQKGSRRWKRLQARKAKMLARNNRQRKDIEHKVTRAIANYAKSEGASRLVVGDIKDIGKVKRLRANSQQKISEWSHGRQVQYLTYKLAAFGIALERQSEAYSSKTCPECGTHNKPRGRNYRCSSCGFVGHRDAVGAVNQISKAVYGDFGRVTLANVMYQRGYRCSPFGTRQVARE